MKNYVKILSLAIKRYSVLVNLPIIRKSGKIVMLGFHYMNS